MEWTKLIRYKINNKLLIIFSWGIGMTGGGLYPDEGGSIN